MCVDASCVHGATCVYVHIYLMLSFLIDGPPSYQLAYRGGPEARLGKLTIASNLPDWQLLASGPSSSLLQIGLGVKDHHQPLFVALTAVGGGLCPTSPCSFRSLDRERM